MNPVRISAILSVTAFAWGIALAAEANMGGGLDAFLQRLDGNRDGVISRQEAARERDFALAFRGADGDRDGRLSHAEYAKASALHERVRANGYAEDAKITAKVKAALLADRVAPGLDINVKTREGVVLLSGFVASPKQADRAQLLATRVAGVREVHTQLVVQG
jgi:hyperosmotically inducible protein